MIEHIPEHPHQALSFNLAFRITSTGEREIQWTVYVHVRVFANAWALSYIVRYINASDCPRD